MVRLFIPALGVAITIVSIEFLPLPFAWVGCSWFVLLLLLAWRTERRVIKVALFNLAFVPLAFGGFELYLGSRTRPHHDPAIPSEHRLRDDVVGHKLATDVSVREALSFGNDLVYDAVYTTDPKGLRVAPTYVGDGDGLCLLFFGGSFTFGHGLNDDEAIPWLTAVLTGGRHRVYNLAYSGWGAHQMLAQLQSGRVDEVIDCLPTHAIYYSIHDHVQRAAGRSPYDPFGPRFVLHPDGGVEHRGSFDDAPSFAEHWARLVKSHFLNLGDGVRESLPRREPQAHPFASGTGTGQPATPRW